MSTKPVRRLLSQKLVEMIYVLSFQEFFYRKSCVRALVPLPVVAPISTNFRIFEHILARLGRTQDSAYDFSAIVSTVVLVQVGHIRPRWDLWST